MKGYTLRGGGLLLSVLHPFAIRGQVFKERICSSRNNFFPQLEEFHRTKRLFHFDKNVERTRTCIYTGCFTLTKALKEHCCASIHLIHVVFSQFYTVCLFHCYMFDESISHFLGTLGLFCVFYSISDATLCGV